VISLHRSDTITALVHVSGDSQALKRIPTYKSISSLPRPEAAKGLFHIQSSGNRHLDLLVEIMRLLLPPFALYGGRVNVQLHRHKRPYVFTAGVGSELCDLPPRCHPRRV